MNKLKNMKTGTILTMLLLTFMGTALAQDPTADSADPCAKNRHHQRGNQQIPAVEIMMRGIRHLELSAEQEANIKVIMQGLRAEERLLTREIRADHEQLRELIKAETFDEPAVAALAEKQGGLTAERLISSSRAMSQVYAQLTDEQRAQLEIMAAERKAKNATKREHRPDKS